MRKGCLGRMLLLALWALAAAPASAASLAELAEEAAARSGGREAMAARTREAEAASREARLRRLPALSARVTAARADDPVYAFGARLRQRVLASEDLALERLNRPGYRTSLESSLELGVPLFTAFELETQERLGQLAAGQARHGESGETQQARWRVAEAYLAAAAKSGALAAARARIRLAAEDVAAAKRLTLRGLVLGSDQLAAEAILEGLRAWAESLQGELEAERASLGALTGRPAGELELTGRLGEPSYAVPPAEALAREGARRRPDVGSARLSSEAAAAAARQAKWSLLPRAEAFASLESDSGGLGAFPSSRRVGARLWVPFGDPGFLARRRRTEEAAAVRRADERRISEAAALELARAFAGYRAAAASLGPLKAMKANAAAAAEAFRPLYREGRRSVLEALRAHEAAARAEAAYLDAAAEAHASYARLLLAAGALDAGPVAEISRSLEAAR
ncbi:MAG: TolC family protein [Elusimicrobia bacterium]|nr:TolC family protein [Elusimicrobiota bacterium]